MVMTAAFGLDGGQGGIGIHVTGTGAILQFSHRIFYCRGGIRNLGMRIGLVTVGMTARAIRTIRCIWPGGRIRVGGVTTGAAQIETCIVITGILGRGVHKYQWRPCGDGMTHIAFTRSGHVSCILAGGAVAIMASRATAGDGGMIEGGRFPCQR